MFRSSISSKTAFLIPIHTVTFSKMVKRAHPDTENTSCVHVSSQKRSRVQASTSFSPKKIATPEAAAAVDADPPFFKLKTACQNRLDNVAQGRAVMYWMRLADLRSKRYPGHTRAIINCQSKRQQSVVSSIRTSTEGQSPSYSPFHNQSSRLYCS